MLADQTLVRTRRVGWSPAAAVSALHVSGLALAATAISQGGTHALTAAAGLAAYLLGVRHAFDPDHIVAIDNTTRYLRAQRRPAGAVGFWFSVGHSTVVLLACMLLAFGWRMHETGVSVTGMWGPAMSGAFLFALAAVNGRVLTDLWRHRHRPDKAAAALASRGFVARLVGRRFTIRRPGDMVAVGFLFGLGFDTATSVSMLLLAAGTQHAALSWTACLALPLLFAAGMTLFDSLDGVAMDRAYGWADSDVRRLRYNLTVTAVSVAAAALVGGLMLTDLAKQLA